MVEKYHGKIEELWEINWKDHYDIEYDVVKIKVVTNNHHPDTKDIYGKYFLHYAAEFGMDDIVNHLIDIRANVNIEVRDNGITPLSIALVNGRYDTAKILISNGARISNHRRNLITILMEDEIESFTDILIDQHKKKDFITFLLKLDGYLTKKEEKDLKKYRLKLLFERS